MQSTPAVSIVIPTHNRSSMLVKSLQALCEQTWPLSTLEVIVVADSCQDDTAEMVTAFAQQAPYCLRLFSHAARSASATRNLGAANARGSRLLFMDDDILPQPKFVEAHMQVQGLNHVAIGYSKPTFAGKPTWWQAQARLWWEDTFYAMSHPHHRYTYRDFFSGNVSLSAELFRQVGGFDEAIRWKIEDYELGLRLLKAGARFCFVLEALGHHCDQTDLRQWLRGVRQEGVGDLKLGELHLELRNIIFGDLESYYRRASRWKRLIHSLAFQHPKWGDWVEQRLLTVATFCEYWHLRLFWWLVRNALREYNYWRGVANALAGNTMAAWLQEGPPRLLLTDKAIVLDIDKLPTDEELGCLLNQATEDGLVLTKEGLEVVTVPPQFGAEPLRKEHLYLTLQTQTASRFIPILALPLVRAEADRNQDQ